MSKQRGVFEKVPGSGDWWIRYFDAQGRLRREKAGTWSCARDLYIKRKNDALDKRKLPEKISKKVVRFAELGELALKYSKENKASYSDDVLMMCRLKGWFGDRDAETVTPLEIEEKFNAQEWKSSTRNHYKNLMSLSYRLGIKHGKVRVNAARGVERKKENNGRVRFLSPAEEDKLRAVLQANPFWAQHEVELDLALSTGLRRGDMYRRLRWENVSLERRTYTIPQSKNGDPFHGRLNRAGLAAVREFLKRGDGTGAVVRNLAGKPLDTQQGRPDHRFKPALEKAQIANLHWHDLRQTFASRLIMAGGNLRAATEAMGHKTISMVMRYAHLSPDFQQGTVDLLDSFGKRTDTATSTGPKHELSEKPEYVN